MIVVGQDAAPDALTSTQRYACGQVADLLGRLPDALVAEMRSRGVSQTRLADETGLSRQAIHRWVNGRALPRTQELVLLLTWLARPARPAPRPVPSMSTARTGMVWLGGAP